jgi:cytochrome c
MNRFIFLFVLTSFGMSNVWADDQGKSESEVMIDLAWSRGCFNCHDLDKKLRGPAWKAVAERYRGEDVMNKLVDVVRNGGSGNWGDSAMSPNRRVPEEDIRRLVEWLLTLE